MIIPFVSSLSEDALSAVPKSLRNASKDGLGATRFQTAFKVMVPAASSELLVSAFGLFREQLEKSHLLQLQLDNNLDLLPIHWFKKQLQYTSCRLLRRC